MFALILCVDSLRRVPVECRFAFLSFSVTDTSIFNHGVSAMSLVKIIVITIALILSILFFGRFLF